jgi:phosphatidylserine/phosphatidylglycerophosphate/cardiolipin synthase-like enzyme
VILAEGQPVGGLSTVGKGVQGEIVAAMNRFPRTDHFYEMTGKAGGTRRFKYDHAKYAVIDGTSVLIGSENYSPTGNPEPGTVGNRGWEVVIHDVTLAAEFSKIFANDATTRDGDVLELTGQAPAPDSTGAVPPARFPLPPSRLGVMTLQATAVTPFTSPDTSLNGLVAVIRSARQTLDIEQMTFNSAWATAGSVSPLLTEVIAAAKRGVKVRVLLNDESAFNDGSTSKPINIPTVQLLTRAGIPAKIANVKAMGVDYIHNKGVIVDNVRTLISSINWDANSVLHNRESAVAIDSPEVAAYYAKIFDGDWTASGGSPLRLLPEALAPESLDVQTEETDADLTDADLVVPLVPIVGCPSQAVVKLVVGKLQASDTEDRDYLSLSGETIAGTFVRKSNDPDCVLVEKDASGPIASRRFLEIGKNRDGKLEAQLDGFTPHSSKVYSVRSVLQRTTIASGSYPASFYAGPSSRELLGPAVLNLLFSH